MKKLLSFILLLLVLLSSCSPEREVPINGSLLFLVGWEIASIGESAT